jgi:hypothetical protein
VPNNPVDVPDDGTLEAGATLHYQDNGDGTITDRNTRLTWEKKSDDSGLHDKDNAYYWSGFGETIWDWLEQINTEGGKGFAGHNDWRIPNVKELHSIINYERFDPTVNRVFNNNCTPGVDLLTGSCTAASLTDTDYWSSSTIVFAPESAWLVNFRLGGVDSAGKNNALQVRAVRGGCR